MLCLTLFTRLSVNYLFPYPTEFDEESWWASQFLLWLETFIYFRQSSILLPSST
eukprot:UN04877